MRMTKLQATNERQNTRRAVSEKQTDAY